MLLKKREELWREYLQNKSERAFQELVESYLPLVKHIAGRLNFKLPLHMDQEDLVSCGIFGLMEALKKFDPSKGVKFETYAAQRIRGSIVDALRQGQWAPRSVASKLKEFQRILWKLEGEEGKEVSESRIAEEMGISVDEVHSLLAEINKMAVISLEDFLLGKGEGMTVGETLSDAHSPNPLSEMVEEELKRSLVQAVEALPDKDRLVISLYYYEGLTLREIGRILGVSESRVSQLHARAILKLREALKKYINQD
ncbi:MAG TPA: FliA/WhiG family RNA polymerase sigma factor [Peptococcaceae bacterium]|nr:MAG: RNA polymerase sigma factor [Clostridia bacterium 41_269]HBT20149.1 FliA/WhiG family RNA polymerase sigma factor [Peptococcaceae bacterium]